MPEFERVHPGILLKTGFLDPMGIAPRDLAKALGVSGRRIAGLVRGAHALTAEMAGRLGVYFQVPALWFLDAQARWDAARVEQREDLRRIVEPCARLDDVIVTPKGVVLVRRVERSKPVRPWMASAAPPAQVEGVTRVVHYPHDMVALEHR